MVKKQNLNNMDRNFKGDDEPQEIIKESEEHKSESEEDKESDEKNSGDDEE